MAAATDMRSSRPFWPLIFFLALGLIVFGRLAYLTIVKAPEYSAMASEARTVSFPIEPRRGTIYDRNGTVLAVSVEATTIYANPVEIDDPAATAAQLASVLGNKMEDYLPILTANKTN